MDRFIARENIKHFRDRLKCELDPRTRSHLQRLLVEEEDKLASDLELIANVEQAMANFAALVELQKALVAALERDGHDGVARNRALLDGLTQSQVLHKEYHQKLLITFQQGRL